MAEADPVAQFQAQMTWGSPNSPMNQAMQQIDDPKARESLRQAMRNAPQIRRSLIPKTALERSWFSSYIEIDLYRTIARNSRQWAFA